MADESLKNMQDLTNKEIQDENKDTLNPESTAGDKGPSINVEGEVVDEKTKQGFQKLIAKKDQEISKITSTLEEVNQKLSAFEQAEKDRKFSEMTETERLKAERDDYAIKFAKSELRSFVTTELTRRNLMNLPLAEVIIESPWALPVVKSQLPDNPGWDETIDAVKAYLPSYLDTLIVPEGNKSTPNGEQPSDDDGKLPPQVPTERGEPSNIQLDDKRVWTKQEIALLQKDTVKWMKYREAITKAFTEGRVV